MQGDLRVELEDAILNALSNMTNIEKLVWTVSRHRDTVNDSS